MTDYIQPGPPPGAMPPNTAPPGAAPPKNRTPLVVFGVAGGCALLVVACAVAVLIATVLGGGGATDFVLSHEQQRLIREFGPPETFQLAYASDVATAVADGGDPPLVRLETWEYPQLRSAFTFRDGVFIKRDRITKPKAAYRAPALRPDLFRFGMSPKDVDEAIGAQADAKATPKLDGMDEWEVRSWRGQVSAAFADGKLVYVRTLPVAQTGGTP